MPGAIQGYFEAMNRGRSARNALLEDYYRTQSASRASQRQSAIEAARQVARDQQRAEADRSLALMKMRAEQDRATAQVNALRSGDIYSYLLAGGKVADYNTVTNPQMSPADLAAYKSGLDRQYYDYRRAHPMPSTALPRPEREPQTRLPTETQIDAALQSTPGYSGWTGTAWGADATPEDRQRAGASLDSARAAIYGRLFGQLNPQNVTGESGQSESDLLGGTVADTYGEYDDLVALYVDGQIDEQEFNDELYRLLQEGKVSREQYHARLK